MKPFRLEAVDQAAHFLAAALIVWAVRPDSIWQSVLLGFICGFIREFTEDGSILGTGSLRDLLFWTLGGLSMGLILA